ncbi:ABC transporter substrate binding protein, partial [Bradyrhizobium sp. JYMT SZCCT0428]|uniref:ABC transporter substrate binding protein n=1 Tax=Bradyrhizobium sp. JYMT SZCCT0428 TaxID=2807673 RepID=UPI0024BFDAA5
VPHVGILNYAAADDALVTEFRSALRELGHIDGREFVDEGGLMSYGPNVPDMVRKAASYVDRIIKGEKPGDLPIEQPARLELIVNLKTAKALGFDIPPTLLAVVDSVIE